MTDTHLSVLIHTESDDLHGLLVAMALRERGHQVVRSFGNDLPLSSAVEFRFGEGPSAVRLHHGGEVLDLDRVDVVWNRNPQLPSLGGAADDGDGEFSLAQLLVMQEAAYALTDGAFWANAPRAVRMAGLKPLQLRMAPAAGLRIPPTLVSNEPMAIRDFVDRHPETTYKPLNGKSWAGSGVDWTGCGSSRVRPQDLPHDELLRLMAGIFQARISRCFDVRAQFFGDTCFALRVDSDRIDRAGFDGHARHRARITSEPVELPMAVHQGCRNMMDALGVVSCAFDFAVTPDGEWMFLELNQSAQFMFLEMWCPELNVLDACCAFLESRDADFRYQRPERPARLDKVYDPARHDAILRAGRLGVSSAMRMPAD